MELTVFAPTNAAFTNLIGSSDLKENLLKSYNSDILTSVLQYHVLGTKVEAGDLSATQTVPTLNGQEITITTGEKNLIKFVGGESEITAVDVQASNGVIHVIDTVLVPGNVLPTYADIASIPPAGETSILAEALVAADLLDVFKGTSDTGFTVFAPTNAAFVAALDALKLTKEELFADKALLTKILKYHVVSGALNAGAVTSEDSLTTITDDSQKLSVQVTGETVKINDAEVIAANVRAWNGYVHVIDAVLVPTLPTSAPTAAPTPSSAGKIAFSMIAAPAILLQLF